MKPAEFKHELETIDVTYLDKPMRFYKRTGRLHIVFGITSFVVGIVCAFLMFTAIYSPEIQKSDSTTGWILIFIGFFIFLNGIFDLARNFFYSSALEFKKARLLVHPLPPENNDTTDGTS